MTFVVPPNCREQNESQTNKATVPSTSSILDFAGKYPGICVGEYLVGECLGG